MSLWGGRFRTEPSELMKRFGDSMAFDQRLYAADIRGSIAYAGALEKAGVITAEEQAQLVGGLEQVRGEFEGGAFEVQPGDDLLAETKGTAAEESLEEIEEDVNLDTFGSGSGLLDLSLQADDTSLGGILDEIYTSESGQETAEGPALEADAEAVPIIPEEEELAAPEPVAEVPLMPQAYAAPPADTVSNALGIMLLLPLVVVVYTTIVAVLTGVATPSDDTVEFMKRDGETAKVTITYGDDDGERTVSEWDDD